MVANTHFGFSEDIIRGFANTDPQDQCGPSASSTSIANPRHSSPETPPDAYQEVFNNILSDPRFVFQKKLLDAAKRGSPSEVRMRLILLDSPHCCGQNVAAAAYFYLGALTDAHHQIQQAMVVNEWVR